MIKIIRGAKLALPAAVAILAMAATSSAAAAPNLVLKDWFGTETVTVGSPVEVGFVLGNCGYEFYGTVLRNQKPTDVVHLTSGGSGFLYCEPPQAISGLPKEMLLTSEGRLVFGGGAVTFTKSASCSYTFKGAGSFEIPGVVIAEEAALTGERTANSSPSCPAHDTERLVTTVTTPERGDFEASLG